MDERIEEVKQALSDPMKKFTYFTHQEKNG